MGKIELDHTGSGSGITLSSDGTDLLLDGTAVGGALELYAENPSSPTAPSATGTNSVAIGDSATAVNTFGIAIGPSANAGSYAIALGYNANASGSSSFAGYDATASGSSSIAIGGNAVASGTSSTALGYGTDATGDTATAVGRNAQARATSANAFGRDAWSQGSQSTAIGDAYASGADSLAAAIANNSSSYGATGSNSVAIGSNNKATATGASAIGGYYNQATGSASMTFGNYNVSSGTGSVVVGTRGSTNTNYKYVYSGRSFGTSVGQGQYGLIPLAAATSDATSTALTTDDTSAGTDNQVVLPNDSVYGFTGTVIAREDSSSTDDFAVWEIKGGAVRGASASTTALGSYNINKISESTGAANWSIALSADTTNGAVAITVTGEAAHNIRWVATINTTEVTY